MSDILRRKQMTVGRYAEHLGLSKLRKQYDQVGEAGLAGIYKDRMYTVPRLEFYECSARGEEVYDREAMRQIESCSPPFGKNRSESASRR